jgi:hypothetical protein
MRASPSIRIAFEPVEGWSRDATADIADALDQRLAHGGLDTHVHD